MSEEIGVYMDAVITTIYIMPASYSLFYIIRNHESSRPCDYQWSCRQQYGWPEVCPQKYAKCEGQWGPSLAN